MEEKRRDTASSPAAPSSAEMDSASTRRRAGALKRKANSQSMSNSSPAPSKRITRDKSNLILQPQVNHYGPLTRARHGAPSNLEYASPLGSTVTKPDELVLAKDVLKNAELEDLNKASEEWEALEAKIEANFEAIRSLDTNAHVVPNHCGWFSWTRTHPLEERMLPSFFNGKTAIRNPDLYLDIRNWIMKKFHANPNVLIEQKDLLELEAGDLDARLEVLEFLDYWGLINFHPFPTLDSATVNGDKKRNSSLENLFHFETMESGLPKLRHCHRASLVPSSFLPQSALAEELGKDEGPSVEYHCNSCSGDCSRRRFHCQKQADFDLCTECFNDGKFGSDMSSSDFILMESAEAPGVSSGKWTDQETLLLLEALELFKENWNEIAEHVATKTKAQCILHFVQMPIEDTFLDCDDEVESNSKENIDSAVATAEAPVPEDTPQMLESKTNPDDSQVEGSTTDTSKTKDVSEVQVSQEASRYRNEVEVKAHPEKSKLGDVNELKAASDNNENIVLKALREAFEAIGYPLTPENTLSFADVGNPVMALAGFLTKLVEPDIATATARNSLKSISGSSSGLLLAAKHCFVLEDPPTDKKEPASESVVGENTNQDVQKVDAQEDKSDKEEKSNPVLDGGNSSGVDRNHDAEACVSKVSLVDDQPTEKKEPSIVDGDKDDTSSDVNDSNGLESQKDQGQRAVNNSDDLESQVFLSSGKNSEEVDRSVAESSQAAEDSKDKDTLDSLPSGTGEPGKPAASKPDGEATETAETLDINSNNANQQQQHLNADSTGTLSPHAAAPKDEEMLDDSLASERKKALDSDGTNLVKQNGTSAEGNADNCDAEETEDDHNINKLKSSAVTALSAAVVKAKLLADQEEDQIRQLATSLVEKQLHKLETKLGFFNEMESVMMRVKEQLERSKQKLYHERAQIIATRLGLPGSTSRPMVSSTTPANRIATNFANAFPRPPMGMSMTAPRPPLSRPTGSMAMASNPLGPGSSIRNGSQDNPSSVVTK